MDEERSVLPRLRGRSAEVDAALAAMVVEHQDHLGPLAELVAAFATLSATPGRHGELAPGLLVTLGCLEPQLLSHLGSEETVVISGMRRWLSPQDDADVVAEVRLRRAAPAEPEELPRKPSRA
jgi:hypothetical protein